MASRKNVQLLQKKKWLSRSIIAGIMSMALQVPLAAEALPAYEMGSDGRWQTVEALPFSNQYSEGYTPVPVFGAKGNQPFELVYVSPHHPVYFDDYNFSTYDYAEYPGFTKGVTIGAKYWAEMLKTQNIQPLQVFVETEDIANANATQRNFYMEYELPEKLGTLLLQDADLEKKIGRTNYILHPDRPLFELTWETGNAYTTAIAVNIGQYLGAHENSTRYPEDFLGWHVDGDTLLCNNEQSADLVGTMRHELGHGLGIVTESYSLGEYENWLEAFDAAGIAISAGHGEYVDSAGNYLNVLGATEHRNDFQYHLMDQNGNMVTPERVGEEGLPIITTATYKELAEKVPYTLDQQDFFILDNPEDEEELGASRFAGKAFFVGEHVSEVLGQAKEFQTPKQGVYGLTVSGFENGYPDLNHLQTNGMMSHLPYSNYTSFMEVELAAMQDLGYELDRRNYFGASIYASDATITNDGVYYARNAEGTAYVEGEYNTTPLGIGLHVYGKNNTITQTGEIMTKGTGAVGVKIDGSNNKITIASGTGIHADGYKGIGVLTSYGSGHELNVAGDVTAKGDKGEALRLDFGSSTNGASDEYRGSYIRYLRTLNYSGAGSKKGEISQGRNLDFDFADSYYPVTPELEGAMLKQVNISGSVEGAAKAVAIGKNAFVKEINLLKGAKVKGDIVNEWKHFQTQEDGTNRCYNLGDPAEGYVTADTENPNRHQPLRIRYQDKLYDYGNYLPDLVTTINFKDDFTYDGNIQGADNTKLKLQQGSFLFAGTADVVSVEVGPGTLLQGGSFKLNNMDKRMAEGYADASTGKLINKGTISASLPEGKDTLLNIEGNVQNDGGRIAFIGNEGHMGRIRISGELEGEKVLCINPNGTYLPGDSYDIKNMVQAGGANVVFDKALDYIKPMYRAVYGENFANVSFLPENNLGSTDPEVNAAFDEFGSLSLAVLASREETDKELVLQVYNMDNAGAGRAIKHIKGAQVANSSMLYQQGHIVHDMLRLRLQELARPQAAQPDNTLWAKMLQNKGTLDGGRSDYRTRAYALGWDKQLHADWHVGLVGSYADGRLAADAIHNQQGDYRLGVYGAYNKEGSQGLLYLDYGWGRNKLQRSIPELGLHNRAEYQSNILEIGAEYKKDLHAGEGKSWQVEPFVGTRLNYYRQHAYDEKGAGSFSQRVESMHNTYFELQTGLELRRAFAKGNGYGIRLGYRRSLTGTDPQLHYSYVGDSAHRNGTSAQSDRDHAFIQLDGEAMLSPHWSLSGQLGYERGRRDYEYGGEVLLKYSW